MTTQDFLEYILTEQNKVGAPNLLISDYVYFMNKAVLQYVNKWYNAYEISQQLTDNLRVLRKTKSFTLNEHGEFILPDDYQHLLVCLVEFENKNCSTTDEIVARRLTSDLRGAIANNYYYKPSKKRPYYFLGKDNCQILTGGVKPLRVTIDYLKSPEELSYDEENPQELEFPDYVCYEIINEALKLILAASSDPLLQTNMAVNQTIAVPGLEE